MGLLGRGGQRTGRKMGGGGEREGGQEGREGGRTRWLIVAPQSFLLPSAAVAADASSLRERERE